MKLTLSENYLKDKDITICAWTYIAWIHFKYTILYHMKTTYSAPGKLVEYSTHWSSLPLRSDGSTSESANSPLV